MTAMVRSVARVLQGLGESEGVSVAVGLRRAGRRLLSDSVREALQQVGEVLSIGGTPVLGRCAR